jgi:co-chaperonin GroES (HSP10)
MSKCPFRPLRNNVILIPVEDPKKKIVLDQKTKVTVANKFCVVAAGPGLVHDGKLQPMSVKAGDVVAVRGGEVGMFMRHKDETWLLVCEFDIVAVVED